jgi:hypothetical protein
MDDVVEIKNGAVYLSAVIAEKYFANIQTAILVRKDESLLVLPVHHVAAGGYLLKRRNAAGDRVIHGADFLRDQGFDGGKTLQRHTYWDPVVAGLFIADVFAN